MCSHQTHTPQTWDPRIDPPLPLPPPLRPPEITGACDSWATRAQCIGMPGGGAKGFGRRATDSPVRHSHSSPFPNKEIPCVRFPSMLVGRTSPSGLCKLRSTESAWHVMGKMSDTLVHQVYVSASGMKCNIDSSSPTPDSRVPPPRVLGLGRSGPRSLGRTRARTTRGGAMHQDERRLVFNSLSGSMLPTRTQHPTPPPRCQTTAPSH